MPRSTIDLDGVHYAHKGSVPLIHDLSLRLEAGWTGLVGPNGVGKTTLLHLLEGRLHADAGRITRHPRSLDVHLCAQEVEDAAAGVAAFAEAHGGAAHRLRGQLRLDPEQLSRWGSLSPGERKRWQVGAALAAEPGALLLDEPTNHLDAEAREELLEALARYRGVGVVVSHDRELLDRLTSWTLRFEPAGHASEPGTIGLHRGAYGEARAAWEAVEREQHAAREQLRAQRKRERRRLADSRRRHDAAGAGMSTRRKMKSARDSDARLVLKQKRRRTAEVAAARDVRNAGRRIERLDDALAATRSQASLGRSLFVDWQPAPVPHLMEVECDALRGGDEVLARDLRLAIGRETRVQLAGPNGCGKTTLMRALLAGRRIPAERMLHLPQELDEAEARALLEEARGLPPDARGRLLNVVAALGVDPDALLESERPSPGEARKLCLAGGLSRQVQALLLDEPTNHLDLPSIERLEEALADYPGALVLISHDATFARRLTSRCWRFVDGVLVQE